MPTGCLPSLLPTPTIRPPFNFSHPRRFIEHYSVRCRAVSSPSSTRFTSIKDFDLYDLLGVDSMSDQSEIKMAYRTLQKRCHPDIVGPPGHDMAIILNEAYRVLSDPTSRLAYDKEQANAKKIDEANAKKIDEANAAGSEEKDILNEARLSAIRTIESISHWLDWESPIAGGAMSGTLQNTPQDAQRREEANIEKLREAAAAWKQASENPKLERGSVSSFMLGEDYRVPSTDTLSAPIKASVAEESEMTEGSEQSNQIEEQYNEWNPVRLGFPVLTAIFAAAVVRLQAGSTAAGAWLQTGSTEAGTAGKSIEQTGGSLLQDILNTFWVQAALAGVTWYVIGLLVIDLAQMVRRKL